MPGRKALFDSNILIYASQGRLDLSPYLESYHSWAISLVTYMEVLGFAFENSVQEALVREIVQMFELRPVSQIVAERVIALRKAVRLKLPDAIIYATAQLDNRELITCNTKDFLAHSLDLPVIVPELKPLD